MLKNCPVCLNHFSNHLFALRLELQASYPLIEDQNAGVFQTPARYLRRQVRDFVVQRVFDGLQPVDEIPGDAIDGRQMLLDLRLKKSKFY